MRRLFIGYSIALCLFLIATGEILKKSFQDYAPLFFLAIITAVILSIMTEYFFRNSSPEKNETFGSINHLQGKIPGAPKEKDELKVILSSMVEGVILVGKDERIRLLSPIVSKIFALRSKDAIGRPYWEVIRSEEINASFKEAIAQKYAIRKEISIYFPNESHVSMQISPILNEENSTSGIVAIFHDITELKKLEKIRTEFVANVSHELKTPLTSIKGFVETLRSGALSDPKAAKKFVEIIQKHAERLENLVNDLLTLSTIESKGVLMNFQAYSLDELVEGTLNLFKSRLEQKNLAINVAVSQTLPMIFVDKIRIEQALSNLLENAIKFTPSGGSISISAKEENGFVRLDVADTGIGISAEHIPRLFERFYRVDKSRSVELGGTGLGLAIVKHIMQSHNSKVTVQSGIDKGSVFSLFLPKVSS